MTDDDMVELVDHVAEVCDNDPDLMRAIAERIVNEANVIEEDLGA
jgi:hypothetical protein